MSAICRVLLVVIVVTASTPVGLHASSVEIQDSPGVATSDECYDLCGNEECRSCCFEVRESCVTKRSERVRGVRKPKVGKRLTKRTINKFAKEMFRRADCSSNPYKEICDQVNLMTSPIDIRVEHYADACLRAPIVCGVQFTSPSGAFLR